MSLYINPTQATEWEFRMESTIHWVRKGNLIDRLIGCHGKSNQQGSRLVTQRKEKGWNLENMQTNMQHTETSSWEHKAVADTQT